MHRYTTIATILTALWGMALSQPAAAGAAPDGTDDWLLMVKTRNTDPAQQAAFNRWYDDIDIPDVLKVPGFTHALRGARLTRLPIPSGDTDVSDGYVALYDIRSTDLDKTIIDMLMASWRMDQVGRSTPLIKVVERVYYHALGTTILGRRGSGERYLLLQRFGGPEEDARNGSIWQAYLQAIRNDQTDSSVEKASRYELYRVLMHEAHDAPAFLTVLEIDAPSDQRAAALAAGMNAAFTRAAGQSPTVKLRDSGLYKIIKDVQR